MPQGDRLLLEPQRFDAWDAEGLGQCLGVESGGGKWAVGCVGINADDNDLGGF